MNRTIYRLLQAFITLGLAAFLAAVLMSGRITWYIHARFTTLVIFAAVFLTAMAGFTLYNLLAHSRPETGHHHDRGAGSELIILALPLALALLIPAAPLTSDALAVRGADFSAQGAAVSGSMQKAGEMASEDRSLLDWMRLFNEEDGAAPSKGEKARLIGFVVFDDDLGSGRFMLGRFIVTCCVADAFPIGLAVESSDISSLKQDAWVEVRGTIGETLIDGQPAPLILAASVQAVAEPDQPYLYP